MGEIDKWRAACAFIEMWGPKAEHRVRARAAVLLADGDMIGRDAMIRLADAVRQIQRMECEEPVVS